MAVASAVVLAALVAGVFGICQNPSAIERLDKTKLAGTWTTLWWPKEYSTLYKCGEQTFTVHGNHIDYKIVEYDITQGNTTTNTGNIRQLGSSGKFVGKRDHWDNLIRWYVLGFSEGKWISYWQCVEETGSQKSFVLKKKGVDLSSDELAIAQAARPNSPDYYGTEDYTNC